MELLAVDRARAAVRDAATRDGSALGSTFGYLPEPQRELAAPAPPAGTIEIVTRASALDYSDSWSGFKLTPERLTMILRQADWGTPLQLFDMYESTLLADGHTRGLYEQRLDEVCVDWTWRAGDARPGSQQAAEELEAATKQIDMEGTIEFLALAPFYGCSYIESAWVTRADGRQVPAELVCVPHRRFMFDPQSRPCLTSETNPYPGDQLERRPGSSWLRAETRRWRRQVQAGILRTVAWWALFKRMSVRDWLIFAEKFGIPLIIGKPGDDDNETTRKALRAAIDALGTEGRAILGGKATIEVLNQALRSGSGAGDHLHPGIVSLSNSEISKAITAGTLTSDTGGPGSFALGQVHADRAHKLSLADGRRIGNVFCRDIGREYLIRNGLLDKAAAPYLHLHVRKMSLLTDSQVLANLVKSGLKVSASQTREHFGQRAPYGPDDVLIPLEIPDGNAHDPADPREPADPAAS
jgi:phage gp29-like protein